jgi:hypothetical protein
VPSATSEAARETNLLGASAMRTGRPKASRASRTLAIQRCGVPAMPRISRYAVPIAASSTSGEAASSASSMSYHTAALRAGSSTATFASRAHALACSSVMPLRAPSARAPSSRSIT